MVQTSLTHNHLELTVPGFIDNLLLFIVFTLALRKKKSSIGLQIMSQSVLMALGSFCPMHTVLQSALFGCGSLLQIRSNGRLSHFFFKIVTRQNSILYHSGFFKGRETF
jgi:hypothetical protein